MNKQIILMMLVLNIGSLYASAPGVGEKAKTEKEAETPKQILVTLPSAEELQKRLRVICPEYVFKLNFINKLAGKQNDYRVIICEIDKSLKSLCNDRNDHFYSIVLLAKQNSIIQAVLQDSSAAIDALNAEQDIE